ncbi:peptide-methionine (S)-S-oxide reductase [Palleronia aestuarii]|uniref:Peptide methionine sulfoxide reductase MsrA n=1 Tax=Palleronia aestuarii TaxID=568105 RepID=A0A2W7NFG8_9RHOB|nr:peptide-methionine (S)-S-oxide reductase MsrA [Palleronia aestuarii]PZX18958.1 peptide-methionine (S)-S-oxide reductase [Palleronia aestuarii]
MTFGRISIAALFALGLLAGAANAQNAESKTAIFAGGCFWCVEADFEKVKGVGDVISGFTGGTTPDPVYRASGDHIESAEIPYDPSVVSYSQLLNLYFRSVDPTDAGGQFCDRGHEYTTAIFVQNEEERAQAEAAKAEAEAQLGQEIVTPILDAGEFYPVDAYHQDYYKSDERIGFSSVGLAVPKSIAYKRYREGCGRDQRVRQLWGDAAPFTG